VTKNKKSEFYEYNVMKVKTGIYGGSYLYGKLLMKLKVGVTPHAPHISNQSPWYM